MHKMNAALERLPQLLVTIRELEDKIKRIESVVGADIKAELPNRG